MTGSEKQRLFEKALRAAGNTHTPLDVLEKVHEGRAQYWEFGETSAITEVLVYPRMSTCNIWLVAGRMGDCFRLERDIAAWARENGCSALVATGRMGWERYAARFGWHARAKQYVKDLQL